MKYLAIIFSIYMAALTLIPCQDKEESLVNGQVNSALQKSEKDVEHSGQEICPPFCTCYCCSVSSDFMKTKAYEVIVYNIQIPYAEYKMPAIAEQFIEIYQPPQIA